MSAGFPEVRAVVPWRPFDDAIGFTERSICSQEVLFGRWRTAWSLDAGVTGRLVYYLLTGVYFAQQLDR
jgi:hypothetical protein